MKLLYIIPIAFSLSCCSSVKKNIDSNIIDKQLMKDVETLSSDAYEGRKTGTKGAEMARAYIKDRFTKLGLKSYPQHINYAQEFKFKTKGNDVNGTNLIGYIHGKVSDVMVISAHYDHEGIIKNVIYNGADDNASGIGGLLKIAAYFAKNKPHNTLIFAAFDAEEIGLQGAKAFVANPPTDINLIKLNLNMDMISHNDKNELYVCGTFKYPDLKQYVSTSNPNIKILFGHDDPKLGRDDWTNQSDHGAFNAKDIPFLYFGVEDHKDYHQPTDKFANINQPFYNNAVNSILKTVINIDQQNAIQKSLKDKMIMNPKVKKESLKDF
jgi:Zn-dependent M28 family amino/carboxypeptidase